jgi:trk system potassium uptake protein TrkA
VNKKLITASRIFRFTKSTDVTSIKCLTGTEAEELEFIAKPDSLNTRAKHKDLDFTVDAIVGGYIHHNKGHIAHGETLIFPGDHVVVFALPSAISVVGKFFN